MIFLKSFHKQYFIFFLRWVFHFWIQPKVCWAHERISRCGSRTHCSDKTGQWNPWNNNNDSWYLPSSLKNSFPEWCLFFTYASGVKVCSSSDGLGQQYITPELAILERGADVIIVGRGIIEAKDPESEAEIYRARGWQAYSERVSLVWLSSFFGNDVTKYSRFELSQTLIINL